MRPKLNPGLTVGKNYEVVSYFRSGCFGDLYIVRNTRLPTAHFIMKVNHPIEDLDFIGKKGPIPDHNERSVREAEITASFNHENIIKVYDLIDIEGGRYTGIIYELIQYDGGIDDKNPIARTLEDVISEDTHGIDLRDISRASRCHMKAVYGSCNLTSRKDGPDDEPYTPHPSTRQIEIKKRYERNLAYSDQLASAVFHLRSKGFLHKDLKPANVVLYRGNLKIIDFGMASHVDVNNGVFANRLYSPPEFHAGIQHQNSDLWSLGLIAVELMTGKYMLGEKVKEKIAEKVRSFWNGDLSWTKNENSKDDIFNLHFATAFPFLIEDMFLLEYYTKGGDIVIPDKLEGDLLLDGQKGNPPLPLLNPDASFAYEIYLPFMRTLPESRCPIEKTYDAETLSGFRELVRDSFSQINIHLAKKLEDLKHAGLL